MIADEYRNTTGSQWVVVTPGTTHLQGTMITIIHNPENASPYETQWNGKHVSGGLHESLSDAKEFVNKLIERLVEMGQDP